MRGESPSARTRMYSDRRRGPLPTQLHRVHVLSSLGSDHSAPVAQPPAPSTFLRQPQEEDPACPAPPRAPAALLALPFHRRSLAVPLWTSGCLLHGGSRTNVLYEEAYRLRRAANEGNHDDQSHSSSRRGLFRLRCRPSECRRTQKEPYQRTRGHWVGRCGVLRCNEQNYKRGPQCPRHRATTLQGRHSAESVRPSPPCSRCRTAQNCYIWVRAGPRAKGTFQPLVRSFGRPRQPPQRRHRLHSSKGCF